MTNYIANFKRNILYVAGPNDTIELPRVEFLEGFTSPSQSDINCYFDNILKDNVRIHSINGIRTDPRFYRFGPFCDYCENQCSLEHYYCYDCYLHICNDCHKQMITIWDQIAKEELSILDTNCCHPNHHIVVRTKNIQNLFICDICHLAIIGSERYNKKIEPDSNPDLMDIGNSIDVCLACSTDKDINMQLVEHKLELVPNNLCDDIFEFGSLMDWVPIVNDEFGNIILFNYNKNSQYVGRYAVASIDDHDRYAYFILNRKIDLGNIINNLIKYANSDEWKKCEGPISRLYNCPIKKFIASLNIPIHYG